MDLNPSLYSKDGKELISLADKVNKYESKKYPIEKPHPIEYIKFVMDQRGLKQVDLVKAGCGLRSHVSEIMNLKRKINLMFIRGYIKAAEGGMLDILIQDYELEV